MDTLEVKPKHPDISFAIVGSGGDGVITMGDMITSAASKAGLFCLELKSYGPQIRGGESSCQVRMGVEPIQTQAEKNDILMVLSWKDFRRFRDEITLKSDAVIIYDQDDPGLTSEFPIPLTGQETMYQVPFKKLAEEKLKNRLTKNIVALGVLSELFNINKKELETLIEEKFSKKSKELGDLNIAAFKEGASFVKENINKKDKITLDFPKQKPNLIMGGNEALAYGALYNGCTFYAGYPITPSSEIMHYMSSHLPRYGGIFVQAEDEMASIGMVLGAAYGGKKAMTATSGPGFTLMQETLSLAAIAEIPLVVVDVQRVGPSTGIPTKLEQSDLSIAVGGAHGDNPRVVFAPTDVEDCFEVAIDAFNIAERFQTPVVILSDQFIGQRKESVRPFDFSKFRNDYRLTAQPKAGETYKRFQMTTRGVSPVAVPGTPNGEYINAGIEHNELGEPVSGYGIHQQMNDKRYKKLEYLAKEYKFIRRYGNPEADLGIITWGSCKGAVKEAVERANKDGYPVSAHVLTLIAPLQTEILTWYFEHLKKVLVVELSHSRQFYKHIKGNLGTIHADMISYSRSGGNPLSVDEVYHQIVTQYETDASLDRKMSKVKKVSKKSPKQIVERTLS